MSLNKTAMLPDGSGPAYYTGEKVLVTNTVDFCWEGGNGKRGYPGSNDSQLFEMQCTMTLTNLRILLIPLKANYFVKVAEFMLSSLMDRKSESTFFGYGTKIWKAIIKTEQDGGLIDGGVLSLSFAKGGAFEFDSSLEFALSKLPSVPVIEPLPVYEQVSASVGDGHQHENIPVPDYSN